MNSLRSLAVTFPDWRNWVSIVVLVAGAVVLGTAIHRLLFAFARRATRGRSGLLISVVCFTDVPSAAIVPVLVLLAAVPWLRIGAGSLAILLRALELALIASLGWFAVACLNAFQDFIGSKYTIDVADNLAARRMRTQVQVLRHIAVAVVAIVTIAVMLMTFPNIRHVGESLFASAGLAALLAGLAARTTLTNLLAGVQIALTQPIRLDDVVIVEGEWGWIEEIATTYVIVRVWDLRRLVVPLSYFIEKPFQNWTRRTADLLGTVFLYTDYTVPVDQVRLELHNILERSGMWDGRVWGLQVTNATGQSIELRALMSAPNGPKAWDLRCHVREKLIDFLQKEYPLSLPRARADINPSLVSNHVRQVEASQGQEGVDFPPALQRST
jgi:small-conductance mechanosensitive channel